MKNVLFLSVDDMVTLDMFSSSKTSIGWNVW